MMRLLSSPASPFGRKVKITSAMKGFDDRISVEKAESGNANNLELQRDNPLNKIPVLVLADGTALYDSKVICEYLDSLKPEPRLFPDAGPARFRTLTLGALADGLMDAALLLVYEKRFRDEDKRVAAWTDRQQVKIDSGLGYLEKNPRTWSGSPDYGHVTLACALGYLDFRHEGRWRAGHPKLVAWLDGFAAVVPAFKATTPVG